MCNKQKYFSLFSLLFAILFNNNLWSQCNAVIGSNISPIKGCEILTIQFNDVSAGTVQNRVWDFGDGTPTSGAQNPTHSYNAGIIGDTIYIVTLDLLRKSF